MGVDMHAVTDQEGSTLMLLMEQENIRLAEKHGYDAVFTTNTSPITQVSINDVKFYTLLAGTISSLCRQ
jgi:hypothetical protein